MLLGMASASASTLGGETVHVPIPGCSSSVTAPSASWSVNPTTASGTTGGASASCV